MDRNRGQQQSEDIVVRALRDNNRLRQLLREILARTSSECKQEEPNEQLQGQIRQLQIQNYALKVDNKQLSESIWALKSELKQLKKQKNKLQEYNKFLQDWNERIKKQTVLSMTNKRRTEDMIRPDINLTEMMNKINHLRQSNQLKQESIISTKYTQYVQQSQISDHQHKLDIKIKNPRIKRQIFKTQYLESPKNIKNGCTSCNYQSKTKQTTHKTNKRAICQCQRSMSLRMAKDRKKSLKQGSNSNISSF